MDYYREVKIIQTHVEGNWTVEVFNDGTLWVQSDFKRKQNKGWMLGKESTLPRSLPKYVKELVEMLRKV